MQTVKYTNNKNATKKMLQLLEMEGKVKMQQKININ